MLEKNQYPKSTQPHLHCFLCRQKKTTVETHRLCAIFWAIRGARPVISGDLHVTLLATLPCYLYDFAAHMGVTLPETIT